jgi:hypothetical protein
VEVEEDGRWRGWRWSEGLERMIKIGFGVLDEGEPLDADSAARIA